MSDVRGWLALIADVVGAPAAPGESRLIARLSSQVDDRHGVGWSMAQLEAWWEHAHKGGPPASSSSRGQGP